MSRADVYTIRIKKPDPIWLAIFLSLLLHLVLIVLHWPQLIQIETGDIARGPMQVTLAPSQTSKHEGNKAEEPVALAKPELPKPKPKPKKKPAPKPRPTSKPLQKTAEDKPEVKVLAVEESKQALPDFTVPEEMISPQKTIQTKPEMESPPVTAEAPTDMMSLVKQRREARAAKGDPSAINALEEGRLSGQTTQKSVKEIIEENLNHQSGTNGIFTVTTLNRFEGTFSFQGWQGEFSNAQRRFYRVDTFNAQEDIRVLMVNKMIEIIRTHYEGDFQWQSRRLGEVITLSARQQDRPKLVRFLLAEFEQQFDYFLAR